MALVATAIRGVVVRRKPLAVSHGLWSPCGHFSFSSWIAPPSTPLTKGTLSSRVAKGEHSQWSASEDIGFRRHGVTRFLCAVMYNSGARSRRRRGSIAYALGPRRPGPCLYPRRDARRGDARRGDEFYRGSREYHSVRSQLLRSTPYDLEMAGPLDMSPWPGVMDFIDLTTLVAVVRTIGSRRVDGSPLSVPVLGYRLTVRDGFVLVRARVAMQGPVRDGGNEGDFGRIEPTGSVGSGDQKSRILRPRPARLARTYEGSAMQRQRSTPV